MNPMDFLKALTWQFVILCALIIGAIVVLVIYGNQTLTGISSFIGAILFTLVYLTQRQQLKQGERLESNTNGTLKSFQEALAAKDQQMIALQKQHTQQIAQLLAQVPQAVDLPKTLAEDNVLPPADWLAHQQVITQQLPTVAAASK